MKKKTFEHVWEKIDELIKEGRLVSSKEVKEELKDDDLKEWAQLHKDIFVPLSKEIQEQTTNILKKFPNMIKISSKGNSNADPFLVATAIILNGTVVTDENFNQDKIPFVCKELNVPCLSFKDFFDEILE